jgi:leader peptidase (prepilin peptidase) / N-methyltransferase
MTTPKEAIPAPTRSADLGEAMVAAGAVGAAVLVLARVGVGGEGLVAAFVAFVLVWLAAIDVRKRILPNRIVLPTTAVVLVAHIALSPGRTPEWLLAALGAAVVLLIPAVIRPGALGVGDVKLAMLLGAALGRDVVGALTLGLFAAGAFALLLVLARGRPALKSEIALGPFLAFGGLVALLGA